jgi:succinate dehydrogenase / fumarate reductase membrane anchor subunit
MELRSALGRVRGLGSAKEGPAHWWTQRVTAVALVPLSIWFVISVLRLQGIDYGSFRGWAGNHVNATLLILLTVAMFQHAYLGVQVVIEDYIHHESCKIVSLMACRFIAIIAAVSSILAVFRLAFGG